MNIPDGGPTHRVADNCRPGRHQTLRRGCAAFPREWTAVESGRYGRKIHRALGVKPDESAPTRLPSSLAVPGISNVDVLFLWPERSV